jgi:hypothetical protein
MRFLRHGVCWELWSRLRLLGLVEDWLIGCLEQLAGGLVAVRLVLALSPLNECLK